MEPQKEENQEKTTIEEKQKKEQKIVEFHLKDLLDLKLIYWNTPSSYDNEELERLYIESILLNLPSAEFILYKDNNNTYYLLDGMKRFQALSQYKNNTITCQSTYDLYELDAHPIYKNLKSGVKRSFDNYKFRCYIIDSSYNMHTLNQIYDYLHPKIQETYKQKMLSDSIGGMWNSFKDNPIWGTIRFTPKKRITGPELTFYQIIALYCFLNNKPMVPNYEEKHLYSIKGLQAKNYLPDTFQTDLETIFFKLQSSDKSILADENPYTPTNICIKRYFLVVIVNLYLFVNEHYGKDYLSYIPEWFAWEKESPDNTRHPEHIINPKTSYSLKHSNSDFDMCRFFGSCRRKEHIFFYYYKKFTEINPDSAKNVHLRFMLLLHRFTEFAYACVTSSFQEHGIYYLEAKKIKNYKYESTYTFPHSLFTPVMLQLESSKQPFSALQNNEDLYKLFSHNLAEKLQSQDNVVYICKNTLSLIIGRCDKSCITYCTSENINKITYTKNQLEPCPISEQLLSEKHGFENDNMPIYTEFDMLIEAITNSAFDRPIPISNDNSNNALNVITLGVIDGINYDDIVDLDDILSYDDQVCDELDISSE